MKFYLLLHNQIMMVQASFKSCVGQWTQDEVDSVIARSLVNIELYQRNGHISKYEAEKLTALVNSLEPPAVIYTSKRLP